ncbi:hypothetical protein G7054_g2990 [Neopestalotiopsis clavispora]|nr:hypothetical protein G7054_g2990 [Neopestalotiopsis clavispora]
MDHPVPNNGIQQSTAATATTRRRRNKKPCPVPHCSGDASERHVAIHTLECRVPNCDQQGHTFDTGADLARHLVEVHNEGSMLYCHWPGCSPNRRRARAHHKLHLRLHNHRLPPVLVDDDNNENEEDEDENNS